MAPDAGSVLTTQDIPPGLAQRLLDGMPAEVRASLTDHQRDALVASANKCGWTRHPADLRLSIPFFSKRFYMVLLAGEERRSTERLAIERKRYPIANIANFTFMIVLGGFATLLGGLLFTPLLAWYLSG